MDTSRCGEFSNQYGFAEIVANAKSRGTKILGILDIWTMNWNFTLSDWNKTVTMNVALYKDDVNAWETWNEPEYPSNPFTADKYFDMLRIAYSIISKEYTPHCEVLIRGGLHLNTGRDRNIMMQELKSPRTGAYSITERIGFSFSKLLHPANRISGFRRFALKLFVRHVRVMK